MIHSGGNLTLLARPFTVSNSDDFEMFLGWINREAFTNTMDRLKRPNSSFQPIGITHYHVNMTVMEQTSTTYQKTL